MATAPMDQPMPERNEIQVYQQDTPSGELKLVRTPERVLDDAHRAAVALQQVIDKNTAIKPVQFGAKKHLLHEHWGMLGHFFGYCTQIESVRYVEFPGEEGTVRGFEATACLIKEGNGSIVGRATSLCLDQEENWGEVAEYEYQDVLDDAGKKIWDRGLRDGKGGYVRERVEVGTKRKPLFQLQSMAETRASAKCYRLKLSWVAVLAGYAPTPAEEMPRQNSQSADHPTPTAAEELPTELKRKEPAAARQPITPSYERPQQSRQQSAVPPRPAPQQTQAQGAIISEPQARRFYALWRDAGKTKAMATEFLQNRFGITDDRKIPVSGYKEACAWAQERF